MFQGGLGDAPPTRKMGSPGKAPDCPFLHFVYTNALLAKSSKVLEHDKARVDHQERYALPALERPRAK